MNTPKAYLPVESAENQLAVSPLSIRLGLQTKPMCNPFSVLPAMKCPFAPCTLTENLSTALLI